MLVPRWGRGTHCADCIRFVQTTTASQMTMHAARTHLGTVRLSTNKAPRRLPTQPFFRPAGGVSLL